MPARNTDKLEAYRQKRKADSTPEPFGGTTSGGGGLFVVQHHAARANHYDFRLEIDGTLRSWAVPKGPSPDPADKRFAVLTEDHPMEYAGFEGNIPAGNYGAGAVIVWDRGEWRPDGDPETELKKGKLAFELHGYKLRGKWALIKTRKGAKDWLLIKELDGYVSDAGTAGYPQDSILSGRTVEQVAGGDSVETAVKEKLRKFKAPRKKLESRQIKPMLAETAEPFTRKGWLFEIKYDGYRLIVAHEQDEATLLSRNGNDLTATFPEIADVIAALPYDNFIMDGEVVVHDEKGLPSFSLLQKRGRLSNRHDVARASVRLPASLYVFDLLAFDGYDLRQLPLSTRKELLRELLPSVGPLKYSDHIAEQGEAMYEQMRELGLEGVVAKKADSKYAGRRSADWVKIVAARHDDFAVAGFTDPKRGNKGFGALLLAQSDGSGFHYMGRVGTGFNHEQLEQLGELLRSLPAATPPADAPDTAGYHYVTPELVAEVRFKEITADRQLRQPVFERLRDDKKPADCLLRDADPPAPNPGGDSPDREVPLSNLDKIFWPEEGYTKGDLIGYYRDIAPWLLPYLADRPVVLTRYPDGIEGKSFFQKDAPTFVPDWIRREVMWSEHAQRELNYFVIDDLETLLYVINMGTIPLHIWSSRVATLEKPDWSILDLDPKEAPFADVVRIARAIKKLCDQIGLPTFAKTSGSTGLHVLIPLGGQCTYEQSKSLAELIAILITRQLPDIATVTRNPAKRGGKVYVDFVQNGHGRTLVSPFSVRPRPGAPVSMPLRWNEVRTAHDNSKYHIMNAKRRLQRLRTEPMIEIIDTRPDLVAALARLQELQQ
ncbi:MAG: DNA ligase D [Gammaproteobacteria bacterium]|nr:DNA ligase D [Gammaproteobacteria bacterium]NNF61577.1 DNA ligase D [Gammaproteobacteria bacterium]